MSTRADKVQIRVEIDGQAGINELGKLEMEAQQLRATMKGLKKDSQEYTQASEQLNVMKDRMAELREQVGLAGMTTRQLRDYQKDLKREWDNSIPDTSKFQQVDTDLKAVNSRLLELSTNLKKPTTDFKALRDEVGVTGMSFQQLQAEWATADPNAEAFAELNRELNQVNSTLAEQKRQLDSVPGAYQLLRDEVGLAGLSMEDLLGLQKELKTEFDRTVAGTDQFTQVGQRLEEVTQHINDQNGVLGKWGQAWADTKKELFSFGVQAAVAGAATAVVAGIGQMIEKNKELADSLSNIQKTTDMSAEEVGELNSQLSKVNTRTASKELRDIAAVAGQLGIAKDQIAAFVVATDKLNVSLGDEITGGAEEVTKVMGGLRNIFTDVKSVKVDQDMLRIGNAINVLASQGAATAPVLADIANRIGGVGITMGLTSGQTLGLAATMQELNISAERGGTAIVKILQHMAAQPEKFSQAAKMSTREFKALVDEDIFGALKKVMEGAAGSGAAATQLASTLSDLGVDGAGASEVIAKMGQNIGMLDEKAKTASKGLTETQSIMGEFDKLNNNFAAKLERVQKGLAGIFTMSTLAKPLEGLITFLDKFMTKASEMDLLLAGFEQRSKEVADLTTNVGNLASRYDELSKKATLSTDEQKELDTVIKSITKAVPEAATEWDKYGNTIKLNTGIVGKWVQQQKEALKIMNAKDIAEATEQIDRVKTTIAAYVGQIQALQISLARTSSQDTANSMKRVIAQIQADKGRAEAELSGYELILARMTGEKTKAQLAQEALDAKAAAAAKAREQAEASKALGLLAQIDENIKQARQKQLDTNNKAEIKQLEDYIDAQGVLRLQLLGKWKAKEAKAEKDDTQKIHDQVLEDFHRLQAQVHQAREKVNLDELDEDAREIQQVEQKYDELLAKAQAFYRDERLTFEERGLALLEIVRIGEARRAEIEQTAEKQRQERAKRRFQEMKAEKEAEANLQVLLAARALDDAPDDQLLGDDSQRRAAAQGLQQAQEKQAAVLRDLKLKELENYAAQEKLTAEDIAQRRAEIEQEAANQIAGIRRRSAQEMRDEAMADFDKFADYAKQLAATWSNFVLQQTQQEHAKQQKADEKAKSASLKTLEQKKKDKLITEEQYQAGVASLEERYERKAADRKRDEAAKQKEANIIQATMDGIVAVVHGLAEGGPPLAAINGLIAAAQIALLVAQPLPEFREGGFTQAEALALPHQNLSRGNGGMLPGGPFLATVNEAGPEYFVPNRLLNEPTVVGHVAAIEAIRTGSGSYSRSATPMPAYEQGGLTGSTAQLQLSTATSTAAMSETTGQAILQELQQLNTSWSTGKVVRAEVVPEELARTENLLSTIRKSASY